MKHHVSFMIIFIVLLQTCTTNRPDIIKDTCIKAASKDPNINLTLCINSFNAVPKAHNSTLKGLGVIATQLSKLNAANITTKIKKALKDKSVRKTPYFKSCLETCLDVYNDAIDNLKISSKAVESGRYDDANVYMSSVIDAPSTCKDGFSDGGMECPLEKEDAEFFEHSVIALSIVAMLQEVKSLDKK